MASTVTILCLCLVTVTFVQCVGGDSDLADRLSRMEKLLAAQDNRLTTLERENQQLRHSNQKLAFALSQLKAENEKLKDVDEQMRVNHSQTADKVLVLEAACVPQPSDRHHGKHVHQNTEHVTQPHRLAARADDTSPLEAALAQMGQQLTAATADIQVLQHSVTHAATSTYTRWGHSACPASNALVYSGTVGGSHYNQPGAAVNYLCLSLSPVMSDHTIPNDHAELFGAEYQTFDGVHHDKDSLCAVCQSPRPNVLMIPGTNVCEAGWTLEYNGYLMAGNRGHNAGSEFVCVDSAMMSRLSSNQDDNGILFYYTATRCGSLPCDPYINNKVVTCAVCSQ